MLGKSGFWQAVALVVGTTVGAGVFALPAIFQSVGWATGLLCLVGLSAIVIFAHVVYWRILAQVHGAHRLLGLSRAHFGHAGFLAAFFVMTAGLFLGLVAYLVIGAQFVMLIFPGLPHALAVVFFWGASSIPVLLSWRPAKLELFGSILMIAGILYIFFSANDMSVLFRTLPFVSHNAALPFGALLFALTGWTAIEPVYELWQEKKRRWSGAQALVLGTIISAALYLLFVAGIFGSGTNITSDTVSGISSWPMLKLILLGIVGLFAVWTSYIPICIEIERMLEKDLNVRRDPRAALVVALVPLVLIALGLNNFVAVIGIAGGVFLGAEYFLILAVGARALRLRPWVRAALFVSMLLFGFAAMYELARPLL